MESLEDLLQIDTDSAKAQENKNLLKQIKQFLKKQHKKEVNLEKKAEELPYEAVSVIGNKLVLLRFDINTKQGIVTDLKIDTRDSNLQNNMALYYAKSKLVEIANKYRKE